MQLLIYRLHLLLELTISSDIILTSLVQFLDALFKNGNCKVRRMHRLVNSVIIFDEIQASPKKCRGLFTSAVEFLVECCNCTVLLCTATQPNLRFKEKPEELITNANELYSTLKRVEYIPQLQPRTYQNAAEDIAAMVRRNNSVLLIVNTKAAACFSFKGVSPALMGACAEKGIGLCFVTQHGRFLARINGPVSGNVLLRKTQYFKADNESEALAIAKSFLLGKIYNGRWCLERVKRDHPMRVDAEIIDNAVEQMMQSLQSLEQAESRSELMGIEGIAAKAYFGAFPQMILRNEDTFVFDGRTRRPPLDPVNAMLSFAYTLLGNEITSALETVGLDPAVGYLHTVRPGRASLALDLLEELRAPLADRFVITQINLGVFTEKDFSIKENGAVFLTDDARKSFLSAWQKRKQETLLHPYLKEKVQWGMVAYVQAMLLSRYLRRDLDAYPPFLWK